jgi:hypothetical protein
MDTLRDIECAWTVADIARLFQKDLDEDRDYLMEKWNKFHDDGAVALYCTLDNAHQRRLCSMMLEFADSPKILVRNKRTDKVFVEREWDFKKLEPMGILERYTGDDYTISKDGVLQGVVHDDD